MLQSDRDGIQRDSGVVVVSYSVMDDAFNSENLIGGGMCLKLEFVGVVTYLHALGATRGRMWV